MMKKVTAAACALLLSTTLSACGGNNSNNGAEECGDDQIEIPTDISSGSIMVSAGCYDKCDAASGTGCDAGETCVTTSLGGICASGNTSNGNTSNGNTSNGNTSNGNTSNGNTSNGNTSNGNTSNGNTSNGNTSNGNTSNGNTSNGNTSNNMMGDGAIGEACADASECATEACLDADDQFSENGYCTAQCTSSADCPGDNVCASLGAGAMACLDACTAYSDCREDDGYVCETVTQQGDGACLPGTPAPERVGEACAPADAQAAFSICDASDDGGDLCLSDVLFEDGQSPYEGGYCSGFCSLNQPDSCGADSHCVDGLVGRGIEEEGICALNCTEDADCTREGYGCYDPDEDGTTECLPDAFGPQPPPESVGVACGGADVAAADMACDTSMDGGDICLYDERFQGGSSPFPDGYCSGLCDLNNDECPMGSHCYSGINFGQTGVGACFETCTMDTDCTRPGHACLDPDQDGVEECVPTASFGPQPPPESVGQACADTAACDTSMNGGDSCFPEGMDMNGNTTVPGGYCTGACDMMDPSSCPTGAACLLGDGMGNNICVDLCDIPSGDTCRAGYDCIGQNGMAGAQQGFCFDADVLTGP